MPPTPPACSRAIAFIRCPLPSAACSVSSVGVDPSACLRSFSFRHASHRQFNSLVDSLLSLVVSLSLSWSLSLSPSPSPRCFASASSAAAFSAAHLLISALCVRPGDLQRCSPDLLFLCSPPPVSPTDSQWPLRAATRVRRRVSVQPPDQSMAATRSSQTVLCPLPACLLSPAALPKQRKRYLVVVYTHVQYAHSHVHIHICTSTSTATPTSTSECACA